MGNMRIHGYLAQCLDTGTLSKLCLLWSSIDNCVNTPWIPGDWKVLVLFSKVGTLPCSKDFTVCVACKEAQVLFGILHSPKYIIHLCTCEYYIPDYRGMDLEDEPSGQAGSWVSPA